MKEAKMWIKIGIEKYIILSDIGEQRLLEILIGEASKIYKRKNMRQRDGHKWINIH